MSEQFKLVANVIAWPCLVVYLVGFFWIVYEATAHAHVLRPSPEKLKATLGEKIAGLGIGALCATFALNIWRAIQMPHAERMAYEIDLAGYAMTGTFVLSIGLCGAGFIMVARDLRRARKERQRFEAYIERTG